ncbi:MAG: DUF4339 domain-containing protein [Verrucomicrobiales bacterium]|nr:DUF4339 domain-containing protein [Verrucomicrobiales bacterium]
MEANWFYEISGERHGPVTSEEILRLYGLGELKDSNLVWRNGLNDWITFSASELAPSLSSPPPPPRVLATSPPPVPKSSLPFVPRQAKIRADFHPQIRHCFERAWNLLKGDFWPIVGCFTLITLIVGIASQFFIPIFFLIYPLMAGFYWYVLLKVRGQEATVDLLFEGCRRQFGPLAILNLIVVGLSMVAMLVLFVIIAIVFVISASGSSNVEQALQNPATLAMVIGVTTLFSFLLMIPMMILSQVSYFASILILDCQLGANQAMGLAWTVTKSFLGKFILFLLLTSLLYFVGMIAFYIGIFVTGAWASVAMVYLYEDAFGTDSVT